MKQDFDHIARKYDQDFTNTLVGKAQRAQVHQQLSMALEGIENSDVLELNCGTGIDAEWIAKQGFEILATDISQEMIAVASRRLLKFSNAKTKVLDIKHVSELSKTFSLIFSDFGGLNCLSPDELVRFSNELRALSKSGTKLSFVIMGRKCFWERLYFLIKRSPDKAYRRISKHAVKSNVNDVYVDTWYYSPSEIEELFKAQFKLVRKKPIGLFVPPSYLNSFFIKKKILFRLCDFLDRWIAFSSLADYGDHYYIELEYQDRNTKI